MSFAWKNMILALGSGFYFYGVMYNDVQSDVQ